MSILVYTESENGKFKKIAFEGASYAKALAVQLNTTVTAVAVNAKNINLLKNYGVDKVLTINTDKLVNFNAKIYADILKQAAQKENAQIIVISSSANAKFLAPLLAVNLEAGYASNVVALPDSISPFKVKRTTFSNKAFNSTVINADIKLIGLSNNAFGLREHPGAGVEEVFIPNLNDADFLAKIERVDNITGKVAIADAEIVVSGGRGLKGPENWGMIEELASILGAATACSKPVSDLGWRPHSEHVGQTGKPVAANLYIAIGISGAIQHLAGVNASKVKVVINSDPEAPFFKAADYGVVGDAFKVVPQLIQKLKDFKANNT
jgi:electron transfer flavoprotein alpha subunit